MSANTEEISITVFYNGTKHVIQTYPYAYRNLMMLLYNELFLDDFGECLGMGKCGTCAVSILQEPVGMQAYDRNEERTLGRMDGVRSPKRRLACQIMVDKGIDGLVLEIREGE